MAKILTRAHELGRPCSESVALQELPVAGSSYELSSVVNLWRHGPGWRLLVQSQFRRFGAWDKLAHPSTAFSTMSMRRSRPSWPISTATNVNAPITPLRLVGLHVFLRCRCHLRELPGCYGLLWRANPSAPSGSYLHKHNGLAVFCDQVTFARRKSDVDSQCVVAQGLQMASRQPFADHAKGGFEVCSSRCS